MKAAKQEAHLGQIHKNTSGTHWGNQWMSIAGKWCSVQLLIDQEIDKELILVMCEWLMQRQHLKNEINLASECTEEKHTLPKSE
jgi:hypothetical protein